MQMKEVRRLVKNHDLEELQAAAEAIENEQPPAIDVEGEDEGDKLTNVLGAIEIKEAVARGESEKDALRAFSSRVRDILNPNQ